VRPLGFSFEISQRDEAWFKREIVPKLDGFSLKDIAKATGLSLAACSRIRAVAKVPHLRHWITYSRWSKLELKSKRRNSLAVNPLRESGERGE
jgi:hypothetical protein